MSRRSHDLPGRSGNPVAGQRAAGGTFQNGFELVGHVMYKSCLILRAMECFSGKPSAINVARSVWEGADEKGPAMVPRQPPTSFGGGQTKKELQNDLVGWLPDCPGNRQTGGKRLSGTATKGDVWLRAVLGEIAVSIARSPGTYLHAQYHRIARRRGKQKAVWAVAHSIIVIIYHILFTKQSYQDLGEDYFHRLEAPRLERHHVRQLEQLGYTVTLSPQVA